MKGLPLIGALIGAPSAWAVNDVCDDYGLLTGEQTLEQSDTMFLGADQNDFLGHALAIGDFNGDGFNDAALGAPGVDLAGSDAGAAYLFFGPLDDTPEAFVTEDADVVILGGGPRDYLGWSITNAGDLDLDGYDDLIIGAPATETSAFPAGYALIILGGPALPSAVEASQADAVLYGSTSGDQFGFAATTIGDMNGDGFEDIAIGAPGNDLAGNNAGAVYLFPGPLNGPLFADQSSAIVTGATPAARAGWSILGIDDFDDDGVPDVAIGAPRDRLGGYDAGSISVIFGSPDMRFATGVEAVSFVGGIGAQLGHALAHVGDPTSNGAVEFVVSAPRANTNGSRAGAVYSIRGDSGLIGVVPVEQAATATWYGPTPGTELGSSLTGADFNGDGWIDLAVGAEMVTGANGAHTAGSMFLSYGPFTGSHADDLTEPDLVISGLDAGGFVGGSASAGLLNDDSYADLLVAGWRGSGDDIRSGIVGLFLGGEDQTDLTKWWIDADGDGYGSRTVYVQSCLQPFGTSAQNTDCDDGNHQIHPSAAEACDSGVDSNCDGVSDGGDSDADGFASCDDCDDRDPSRNPGRVERCDDIDHNCDGDLTAGAEDALFWHFDFDDDGYGGSAVLVDCSLPDGVVVDMTHVSGDCDDADSTIHPAALERCDEVDEDCNGAVDDEAIDAPHWFRDADNDAYGDYGSTVRNCTQPEGFVDNASDCDDQDDEIRPGTTETCNLRDDDCSGLHYLGGDTVASDAAHLSVFGAMEGARLGDAVAILPDATDDDIDELVVGAPNDGTGGVGAGAVFITHGQKHREVIDQSEQLEEGPSWDTRIVSDRRRGQFGQVLTTGDFNGDGVGDLVASAPLDTLAGAQSGRVYLFFGPMEGELLASEADLIVESAQQSSRTGAALDGVDLDGDGFDDLIIGAPRVSQGLAHRGGAFVVYGGPTMTSVDLAAGEADAWFLGTAAGDELGSAVAGVGDVNGDGFQDIALGAPEALERTGQAYLLFGGPERFSGAIASADVALTGETVFDRLGTSIAGLGDFTGNGLDDIAFGSSYRRSWIIEGGQGLMDASVGDLSDLVFVGEASQSAGRVVSSAGDINGDGVADLLVAAQHDSDEGVDAGAVYLVYGGQEWSDATSEAEGIWLDGVESFGEFDAEPTAESALRSAQNRHRYEGAKISGPAPATFAGAGVAGGGDINGDGHSDLVMGAPRLVAQLGDLEVGGAWAILGGAYGMDVYADNPAWFNWDRDMDGFAHVTDGLWACPVHRPWEYDTSRVRALADTNLWLDCNDDDASIYPGAVEIEGDGIDQNCTPEVGNQPPSALACNAGPSMDPAPYLADTSVNWSAHGIAEDPDGTAVSWNYTWLRDDGEGASPRMVELSTGASLASSLTKRGDVIVVLCQAIDLANETDDLLSEPFAIANYVPRGFDFQIDPLKPGTNEPAMADAQEQPELWGHTRLPAVDEDGDPVQWEFEWFVNGISEARTAPGAPAAPGTRTHDAPGDVYTGGLWGDLVTLRVTPFDGTDFGLPAEFSYQIPANIRPTEPLIQIMPLRPRELIDDLACRLTRPSYDPEGEPVSYRFEWFHNGASYEGPTASMLFANDTIPRSQTEEGGIWTCQVTPNDGFQDGLDDEYQVVVRQNPFGVVTRAGGRHACALTTAGKLSCWGDNTNGQATPPTPPDDPFGYRAMATGGDHTCAVLALDGSVRCWGSNDRGQSSPPPSIAGATDVTAGEHHSCALFADGRAECWGGNESGQTDVPEPYTGCTADTDTGELTCWSEAQLTAMNLPAPSYTQIDAGQNHTCGLTTDGTLFCWGDNGQGQATPVLTPGAFWDVQAGDDITCATSAAGMACWGAWSSGTWLPGVDGVDAGGPGWCGIEAETDALMCTNTLHSAPDTTRAWRQVSAGRNLGCGADFANNVVCWGISGSDAIDVPDFTQGPDVAPEICDGVDNNGIDGVDEGMTDSDGDGVCDAIDVCTGDDLLGDTDGDQICDDLDACAEGEDGCQSCFGMDAAGDSDHDGICDDRDVCFGEANTADLNGDGICDHDGAGAVPYYLPFGLPVCQFDQHDPQPIMEMVFRLSPAGSDNTGWGLIGETTDARGLVDLIDAVVPCMHDWADDGQVETDCAPASIDDQIDLHNGVAWRVLFELNRAVAGRGLSWDASVWGDLPEQNPGSTIPPEFYGRVLEGPIPVFDGGLEDCTGSMAWNETRQVVGFVWAAIYDVRWRGSADEKNVWIRLDLARTYEVGTGYGGGEFGVSTAP